MKHFLLVLITLTIVLIFAAAQKTNAATFTVTNTNDSGAGSLRQAILDANFNNAEDIIEFDQTVFNTPQTITLTSGQLTILPDNSSGTIETIKPLTINGPGANLLTISGNNQSRVILVEQAASATIKKVKITGGYATEGAGIRVGLGYLGEGVRNLTLTDSIITGNTVTSSFGTGGGLWLGGYEVLIVNTTISNNASSLYGGGIYLGTGNVRMINSTISKNTAVQAGGGIYDGYSGRLYITNCTVAFNQATRPYIDGASVGGGIYMDSGISTNTYFFARNSIIAKNTVGAGSYGENIWGSINFAEFNIIGSITAGNISGNPTGNQINADPQLDSELKINGGTIPTHALSAGSSAIDKGNNCVLNTTATGGCLDPNIITDERGVLRSQDGDGDGTATVDIGAYEILRADVLSASVAPDLLAINDTGTSNSDNITTNRNLSFNVNGAPAGATVEFFRDGVKIGETTADGNPITFSDNNLPADGTFLYSTRQTVNNTTSLFSAALSVTIDNTTPTVIINQATGQADPVRTQPVNFSLVFSEAIVGFDSTDVSLISSTAGVSSANIVLTGSGTTYNAEVGNITADGNVRAVILANAVQDLAGNSNSVSTSTDNSVTLDTTSPTAAINQAATQADPTRNSQVNFTVVFSEIVNGFTSAGVTLIGSTANVSSSSIVITGSGTTYNVAVNNITSNGGFVQATVTPYSAIDLASNPIVVNSTNTDNRVTVDNVSPTVTINQAAGQADPTNTLPVNFTVVFSEAVSGFDAADISLSGSTVNTAGASVSVTGAGTTYNVAVSNITANGGFLRASVRSGAALDSVGNSSFSSSSTDSQVTVDNIAPNVTINQSIGQSDPASTQPINFTVVFSEFVNGFNSADVSLAGSTANVSNATIVVTGSGNVYTVAVSNITSSGQVKASVLAGAAQDAAGNLNLVSNSTDNTITVSANRASLDFDGDGKADLSVFRPSNGIWYLLNSQSGFGGLQFGAASDKIVPADYDGDGRTDVAVYRDGNWYLQRSSLGFISLQFGEATDVPVPADFDADGKADIAVYRPSAGTWFIQRSTLGFLATQFGVSGDKPVAADFDGDGKADLAVFRPSTGIWYVQQSRDGLTGLQFGSSEDKLVVADYDGDGKADYAVYRPSSGFWYLQRSQAGFTGVQFGQQDDLPVPADYDGDGKTDIAVYRNDTWLLQRSTQGFTGVQFGSTGDQPVPNAFVR